MASRDWNTEEEKAGALSAIQRARAEFESRRQ
jgi:hypothetical protein